MGNLSTRAGTAGEVNFAYDENGRMLTQEYAPARLEKCNLNGGRGIRTMGDIARASVKNPDALYKMFGVNAEILIDHAWGYEPCAYGAPPEPRGD